MTKEPIVGPIASASVIDAEILNFLREELSAEGPMESPIATWYRKQYLNKSRGFAAFGQVLVDLLAQRRQRFDQVTEVGAGIGQTCVQLALEGWPTIAVESGAEVFGWMEHLLARLRRIDAVVSERVRPLKCGYPERASEYLNERTLACFMGLLTSSAINDVINREMIESLRLAGGIILDPRVFFRRRESEQEQGELVTEIQKLGFGPPVSFWDSRGTRSFPYRFLYFERSNMPS